MHSDRTPPLLRFAIITDIHNGPVTSFRGNVRKLGDRALPLLKAFVRAADALDRLDVVVHLGDVVEDVDVETDRRNFTDVIAAMGSLPVPVRHVTGNHDTRVLSEEDLANLRGAGPSFPVTVNGVELLALRTYSKDGRCFTTAEDLAALSDQLAAGSGPALLFAHHGLGDQDLTGNPWFEHTPHLALVDERKEVRALVAKHPRVRAVFNGHLHWNNLVFHGDRPYFTIQSLTENVAAADEPPVPAAAWALVELWDRAVKVSVAGSEPEGWDVVL